MNWNSKENNKQKHLFKSYYCAGCKQRKVCGVLTEYTDWESYCCACYFQSKFERSQEYSDYQVVYQQKVKERKVKDKQLEILKDYLGCKQCGSKEVDAYSLYENNRLVCQPCLMRKAGSASGAISFLEQSKWYKKWWKIDLTEWLTKFECLPVNAECAREWLKDKEHLRDCQCLELEAKELVELFSSSLKKCQEKLRECSCEKSEKVRVSNDDYAWCERCESSIFAASKKRVIKNRNDPRFWGLSISEKVLCLECIGRGFYSRLSIEKKKAWREYRRRGYV